VRSLRDALRAIAEPARLEELQAGVATARERLAWSATVADYRALVDSLSAGSSS
jgi:hypothetical protein